MVKWNNIDLSTKGIIVEEIPTITKGKKRINTYDIEGRNGVLMVDKGTYESFVVSLPCHFNETYSIDEIKSFLDGYGTLSLDGIREYEGIINNQIDFEAIETSGFRKFPIQVLCNPISHTIQSFEKTITSEVESFEIDQTANTYPLIELQGTGDVSITFNDKTFYLYNLDSERTYYLDCNAKEFTDDLDHNVSNQMSGDFPYLKPNGNTILYTGTISSFKITYKKAYL